MATGASPLSKGGAGTVFEYRVAALDLVAMLCCVPVPGLERESVPNEVALQKVSEAPLDDVVVSNGQGPYLLVVERQVKRTLEIVPTGKAWQGLIGQCLQSLELFGDEIDADRRRFGVTAASPLKDLEDLRELAAAASAHASLTGFLQVLLSLGKQYHRVWELLKTTIVRARPPRGGPDPAEQEVELTAFRIVRRLVVQIEAETGPGARYVSLCAAVEERLIPAGASYDAADVFRTVEGLAEEWGPRGGTISREMLRNRLSAKGLVLRGDPPTRAALKSVESWTDGFLNRSRVKDQLGGEVRLDRARLRAELAAAIDVHRLVLLTGPAGTGKSALARAVTGELRQPDGATVIGLSLTEHTWRTVADVDGDLGGPGLLAMALRGAPTGRRLLVVDGAEQALSDDGRLLADLLALVPRDEDGAVLWHVIAVAREQAGDAVRNHLAAWGGRVETMTVGVLADEEKQEVLAAFPGLMPLACSPRAARMLGALYTVDLLVRLLDVGVDTERIVGEEDVADLVYEHLVRRAENRRSELGHPEERSDVYMELAEGVIAGKRFVRLTSGAGPARLGLVSDGILVRERSAFGFAHDAMQDYAVAFALCEPAAPNVVDAPLPRRLLRGVRIGAQLRLSRAVSDSPTAVVNAWRWATDTTRRLAERTDDDRWLDLPFEVLFELGRPEPVLAALADELLADGGRALVNAARLRLRTVVPALPLLRFLTLHAADLNEPAADIAVNLLGRWLPTPEWLDEELAAAVPRATAIWFRQGSGHGKPAAIALALTAQHLGEDGRQVFAHICKTEPLAVQKVLENAVRADHMARHCPDLLVLAARSFYLGRPADRNNGPRPFREGVRTLGWPSVYRPSVIEQLPMPSAPPWVPPTAPDPSYLGPFQALLTHAPDLGVALIGQILDAATDATTRWETKRGRREFSLVWPLGQGSRVFRGTARVWQ